MEGKQDAHLLLQCQPFAVLASLRVLAALALAPLELWHGLACRRMYEGLMMMMMMMMIGILPGLIGTCEEEKPGVHGGLYDRIPFISVVQLVFWPRNLFFWQIFAHSIPKNMRNSIDLSAARRLAAQEPPGDLRKFCASLRDAPSSKVHYFQNVTINFTYQNSHE